MDIPVSKASNPKDAAGNFNSYSVVVVSSSLVIDASSPSGAFLIHNNQITSLRFQSHNYIDVSLYPELRLQIPSEHYPHSIPTSILMRVIRHH